MWRDSARKMDILRQMPLFQACSRAELALAERLVDQHEFAAGDVLMREGGHGEECFVIAEGKATVTLEGKVLATVGAGEVIGEMSLLDAQPRSATVIAETPLVALVLTPRTLDRLLLEAPTIGRSLLRGLSRRLRAVEAQLSG